MSEALTGFKRDGISRVIFGDIFLEWIKEYRENNLSKIGMAEYFRYGGRIPLNLAVYLSGWVFSLSLPVLIPSSWTRSCWAGQSISVF